MAQYQARALPEINSSVSSTGYSDFVADGFPVASQMTPSVGSTYTVSFDQSCADEATLNGYSLFRYVGTPAQRIMAGQLTPGKDYTLRWDGQLFIVTNPTSTAIAQNEQTLTATHLPNNQTGGIYFDSPNVPVARIYGDNGAMLFKTGGAATPVLRVFDDEVSTTVSLVGQSVSTKSGLIFTTDGTTLRSADMVTAGAGISKTYDAPTGKTTVAVSSPISNTATANSIAQRTANGDLVARFLSLGDNTIIRSGDNIVAGTNITKTYNASNGTTQLSSAFPTASDVAALGFTPGSGTATYLPVRNAGNTAYVDSVIRQNASNQVIFGPSNNSVDSNTGAWVMSSASVGGNLTVGNITTLSKVWYQNVEIPFQAEMTTSQTLGLSFSRLAVNATSGNLTLTLPSANARPGFTISVSRTDTTANTVTIVAPSGESIVGGNFVLTPEVSTITLGAGGSSKWLLLSSRMTSRIAQIGGNTVATGAIATGAGTGATATGFDSSDISGTVSVTLGTTPAPLTGIYTVTFSTGAYTQTPRIIVTGTNAQGARSTPMLLNASNTGFTIAAASVPAGDGLAGQAYSFNWIVAAK